MTYYKGFKSIIHISNALQLEISVKRKAHHLHAGSGRLMSLPELLIFLIEERKILHARQVHVTLVDVCLLDFGLSEVGGDIFEHLLKLQLFRGSLNFACLGVITNDSRENNLLFVGRNYLVGGVGSEGFHVY